MTGKILKKIAPVVILTVLLISSCRSLPEGPFPDIVDWLPENSDLILRMVVPGNEELLDMVIENIGLDPTQLIKVRDRTALVAVGLELEDMDVEGSFDSIPIHLAAVGIWPKNLLGSALGKDWKKSILGSYRWNGPGGLELKALSKDEIVLSRGKVDVIIDRLENGSVNRQIRRAFELKNGADLAIWITDPDIILDSIPVLPSENADGTQVIEMLGLALKQVDDQNYSLFLSIYPSDERLSGSLAFALRLGFSARFGMSPDPDERALLTDLHVEIGTGEVKVLLPSMSLDMLDTFLKEMKLFPEVEQ